MSSEHMIVHLLPSVPLESNNTTLHNIDTSDNCVYLQTMPDSSTTQQLCSGSIDSEDNRMICGKETTSSLNSTSEILDFETTYIRDIFHTIDTADNCVYLQTMPDSSTQQLCCGSIDSEDNKMIQQICGKEATSSLNSTSLDDDDLETTYIRDILLAENPYLTKVENAVGSLASTENIDLLNAEALSGLHQPDYVLLEALRVLSEDPSLRKLQAALDVEADIVHTETSRYQGQCIQANNVIDSGMKIKGRKSKNKKSFIENASKGMKKREKTSPASQKILKDWLFSNCYHPYPTDADKSTLCLQTGLSLQQLNNWFINARRRILPNYLKQRREVEDN